MNMSKIFSFTGCLFLFTVAFAAPEREVVAVSPKQEAFKPNKQVRNLGNLGQPQKRNR